MSVTVRKIEELIGEIAPYETAESYDNAGLLLGSREQEITKVLIALDATMDVAEEAVRLGAQLIITHHPLMFHARKNLVEEDMEAKILCFLIRHHIALLSAHTNLDQTFYSGSAACARLLGMKNVRQEDFLFIGELPEEMTAERLRERISAILPAQARLYGGESIPVRTLAICGGSYDEGWKQAKALGAQAFLTGEVRHHNALEAAMNGFALLDGGHYGTEAPLVPYLAEYLQNRADVVEWGIEVYPSQSVPFGRS